MFTHHASVDTKLSRAVERLLDSATEDGIRDSSTSRGLGDVYKRQNAFKASGQQDFGGFLAANEDSVIDSVLKAGDTAIESMPSALKKVYSTLRGKAKKIVSPALPDLGRVVEKYA